MKCPKCQHENPEGLKFCVECGNKLEIICSNCGFGNAPSFALYDLAKKEFFFKENTGCGNGIKTAETLHAWGVKNVVYSYLGDGPFKSMEKEGINIYYIGKEPMELSKIVDGLDKQSFTKVDAENASTFLDPGTNSGKSPI